MFFFHGKTGVPVKDLHIEKAKQWLKANNIDLPLCSPDFTWHIQYFPISFAMDVMRKAAYIIVADSVMYHAAHAMDLHIDLAYFARGNKVWKAVHPLHTNLENVVYHI